MIHNGRIFEPLPGFESAPNGVWIYYSATEHRHSLWIYTKTGWKRIAEIHDVKNFLLAVHTQFKPKMTVLTTIALIVAIIASIAWVVKMISIIQF